MLARKPTIYLETTIVSYLTSRPTTWNAARQAMTHTWWDNHRFQCSLFTSRLVVEQAAHGDPDAVARRMAVLSGIPVLDPSDDTGAPCRSIDPASLMRNRHSANAYHIAVATINKLDILLTWNMVDIANALLRQEIADITSCLGFAPLAILTPAEIMGEPW